MNLFKRVFLFMQIAAFSVAAGLAVATEDPRTPPPPPRPSPEKQYCGLKRCGSKDGCRYPSELLKEAGIDFNRVSKVDLLFVECRRGSPDRGKVVECGAYKGYGACVESKNDGKGNWVMLGVNYGGWIPPIPPPLPSAVSPKRTRENAVFGNAYWFDGVNNELRIPAPSGLPIGSAPRSLNMWFRPEYNNGKSQVPFIYGNQISDDAFYLIWNEDNGGMFRFGRWGGGDTPKALGFPAGQTYMITLTYSGGQPGFFPGDVKSSENTVASPPLVVPKDGKAKIYVNGELIATDQRFLHTSKTDILIGGADFPDHYVKGTIDEVSLWSRELGAVEVSKLYNAGKGAQVKGAENGLVKSWNFDSD